MKIKYDQHFLENKEILKKEIKISNIKSTDIILEIGAGDGRLSKEILKISPKKLISIEKDENLRENLQKIKENYPRNFEFMIGNGLKEIEKIECNKLISNIPYSITEPLYKIILNKQIKDVILIHGKSFYDLILSKKSKWHYFINSFYNVELINEVPGNYFKPIAKVKSVLLKLELKNKLEKKDLFFQKIFQRQNRTIKNALIYSLVEIEHIKKEANKIFLSLNLPKEILNQKFENISNENFIKIIKTLQIF